MSSVLRLRLASLHRSALSSTAAGALACLLTAAPVRAAEDASLLDDSFQVAIGTFILNTDTDVSLDGESGVGTDIDWERDIGDPGDETRFRIDGYWRFADRHKLRFVWFNNSTSSSRTLDEEIEWGDVTYPVNAAVSSDFDFDVYELAYEYSFLRRETYELAGTIGLHWTSLALTLSGEASFVGGEPVTGTVTREGSVDLPLPVVGARGLWNLTRDFWIDASAQYFALSIDEWDGSLRDFRLAVIWQPSTWVGVGLGYNQFDVDVDVDKDSFSGSLDWSYRGPILFYSASF